MGIIVPYSLRTSKRGSQLAPEQAQAPKSRFVLGGLEVHGSVSLGLEVSRMLL